MATSQPGEVVEDVTQIQHEVRIGQRKLDAVFEVGGNGQSFKVVLHSRGGTAGAGNARNLDYLPALICLLERLQAMEAVITSIEVVSGRTKHLPLDQRRLDLGVYSYPIALAAVPDVTALKAVICYAQTKVGQRPGSKGGNPTKRIAISVMVPEPATADDLAAVLEGRDDLELPVPVGLDRPAAAEGDDEHWQREVANAATSRRKPPPIAPKPPPLSDLTRGVAIRRDKDEAADALWEAKFRCEIRGDAEVFTSARTGLPYVEAHHLIPLSFQPQFQHSLDTRANIVSLSPFIHRLLHHGIPEEKNLVIKTLYEKRRDVLLQAGIDLGLPRLLAMYGC